MNTARNVDMAQEIRTDTERMIAEVDLNENAVYLVKGGSIEKLETPSTSHGCQSIKWHDGEIVSARVENSYKYK
jgi:Protein of unknown function (DUF3954)